MWVENDEPFLASVVREYEHMSNDCVNEAHFAAYGRETLLRRDKKLLDKSNEKIWKTERMVEHVSKPGNASLWMTPPILTGDSNRTGYGFDLRPDCSYWLSTRALNQGYHEQFTELVYVINDTKTSPYFTAEFKRDSTTEADTVAEYQVAGSASLALYNRFLLRKRQLLIRNKKWSDGDLKDLRHYGLTFRAYYYTVW